MPDEKGFLIPGEGLTPFSLGITAGLLALTEAVGHMPGINKEGLIENLENIVKGAPAGLQGTKLAEEYASPLTAMIGILRR